MATKGGANDVMYDFKQRNSCWLEHHVVRAAANGSKCQYTDDCEHSRLIVLNGNVVVFNQAKLCNQAEEQHEQQNECKLVNLVVGNSVVRVEFENELVVDLVFSKHLNTEGGA